MFIFRILSTFFLSFLLLNALGQNEFKFDELVYLIDGKDLGSNEIHQYENLDIRVKGLRGCIIVDGFVELGMEIVITDDQSNRLLYSPDMLVDTKLLPSEIKQLQFELNLSTDFQKGKEYFIKIKVWDKRNNRSYSKHSSFRIIESLRNDHVYIDVRRLKISGYKLYLNGDRLYKENVIRENDEVVIDLFFQDLKYEKGEDVVIITEVIDQQNSKKYKLQEDFAIVETSDDIKSVLVKTDMIQPELKHGKECIFHMQFHNASRNQKLDLKFTFVYYLSDWKKSSGKLIGLDLEMLLNKNETKSGVSVEVGDRLDFRVLDFQDKLTSDFGFCKVGAKLALYDGKGKLVFTSGDLYRDYGQFPIEAINSIDFDYTIPFDLEFNSKYIVELIVWDKYGDANFIKKVNFKTSKRKDYPFGMRENIHLSFMYNEAKIDPVSVHVIRNDYKFLGNEVKVRDELEVVTAFYFQSDFVPENRVRLVQL